MVTETMGAIQVFLRTSWGGGTLLIVGFFLALLFALALFSWKSLAFVNAWIALVLAMLLAISSEQRTIALILAILVVLNLLDIPLVAIVRRRLSKRAQSNIP